jgi:hypothetical protein
MVCPGLNFSPSLEVLAMLFQSQLASSPLHPQLISPGFHEQMIDL